MSMGQGQFGGTPSGGASSQQGGPNGAQQQNGTGGQDSGQGQQGQPGQPQLSELGSGFLGRVAPEHQAILAPYVSQWDAGVTRRFQELHGQLRPYQELGADPTQLQAALSLYNMVDENPAEVVRLLQEALGQQGSQQTGQTQPQWGQQGIQPGQMQPQGSQPGSQFQQPQQGPGAVPPEVAAMQQQVQTMQQMLVALSDQFLSQRQEAQLTQQQQQQDAALEQELSLLQKEFGEFDEAYVLAQMMSGRTGEEAVQMYHQMFQGGTNRRPPVPSVPPVISGGGSVPNTQQTIAKAPSKDVRNLVANIMAQANQG